VWQAVIETPTYLADARKAGLTDAERDEIVLFLPAYPTAGAAMPGTGGARKVWIAGRGKGKSGGYRVVTFFAGEDIPVFLLALVDKGDRADLSQKEKNELKRELSALAEEYRKGVDERVQSRKEAD
jgi:hypothetical protein